MPCTEYFSQNIYAAMRADTGLYIRIQIECGSEQAINCRSLDMKCATGQKMLFLSSDAYIYIFYQTMCV